MPAAAIFASAMRVSLGWEIRRRRGEGSPFAKQLALGCLNHEHVQHFLPAGGWTWDWFGDPDQGFTKMQPGGWQFNIPPYIEQPVLHDLGSNNNQAGRTETAQTPLSVMSCPTRRPPRLYP